MVNRVKLMDIKKLFDYEHALQTQRPQFSAEENYATVMQPEKAVEMVSFNVTPGSKEGVFIKFASKDGGNTKLAYLNPVVAKNLIREIFDNLVAQGFEMDDELEGGSGSETRTFH